MSMQILGSLASIASADWDALLPDRQPFLRHAFLRALEDSHSVCARSGWQPSHRLWIEGKKLLAALPAYAK